MHAATSASDSPVLDSAIHGDATQFPPCLVERRHGIEYQESHGFDYPLVLFWGGYAAVALCALVAWLWS